MPIKCAGAPQKAMYLSCDHWQKEGQLNNMNVSFCNAGPVLFGCATYVPPLMKYVDKYRINLDFGHNLTLSLFRQYSLQVLAPYCVSLRAFQTTLPEFS